MKQDLYYEIVDYIIDNQNSFYRLAYSYVKNKEDALDVVQNAVCKALEHYDLLREKAAMKTWFYRILVNESISFLNRKKKETLTESDDNIEIPYHEAGYEVGDDLYDHINCLDEDTQTIIKLRFYEEFSLQEIANAMDMNLNTVKAKLYRGLKLLKQNIEEVGA